METKRPVGRPVGWRKPRPVVDAGTEADRAAWGQKEWEALLDSEGLGLTYSTPHATYLRDEAQVLCFECIGYHTNEAGCLYAREDN